MCVLQIGIVYFINKVSQLNQAEQKSYYMGEREFCNISRYFLNEDIYEICNK